MSSYSLRWMLFLLTLILAGAGPFALALADVPDSEFEERPAEFFCITTDGGRGEACVSLYLNEDGYEVCLSDELARAERCMSSYNRSKHGGGTFGDPALLSPVGLIDC